MRTNPGRRMRRAKRFGLRAPTRMTEHQRFQQAELGRCDAVLAHLGVAVDLDGDALVDGPAPAAAETSPPAEGQEAGQPDYTRPLADREANAYEFAVLAALQDKPVYQQSVPADVIEHRRAKNRAARKARRKAVAR